MTSNIFFSNAEIKSSFSLQVNVFHERSFITMKVYLILICSSSIYAQFLLTSHNNNHSGENEGFNKSTLWTSIDDVIYQKYWKIVASVSFTKHHFPKNIFSIGLKNFTYFAKTLAQYNETLNFFYLDVTCAKALFYKNPKIIRFEIIRTSNNSQMISLNSIFGQRYDFKNMTNTNIEIVISSKYYWFMIERQIINETHFFGYVLFMDQQFKNFSDILEAYNAICDEFVKSTNGTFENSDKFMSKLNEQQNENYCQSNRKKSSKKMINMERFDNEKTEFVVPILKSFVAFLVVLLLIIFIYICIA